MNKPPQICTSCGTALPAAHFDRGVAMRLMGKPYCQACLETISMFCCKCGLPLPECYFEQGRAVTLLGRPYCEGCVESAIERSRRKEAAARAADTPSSVSEPLSPTPAAVVDWSAQQVRNAAESRAEASLAPSVAVNAPPRDPKENTPSSGGMLFDEAGKVPPDVRRMHYRFVPPAACELILKPRGFAGLLSRNLVRLWLDVSEGGCRAILEGTYKHDDELTFKIHDRKLKETFEVGALVRHAKPSQKYPGSMLVGFKFVNPSPFLRTYIHGILMGTPSVAASQTRRHHPQDDQAAEGSETAAS